MHKVAARLEDLAKLEEAARTALDLADRCEEYLIGIRFDECLQCIADRTQEIRRTGSL